MATIYREAKLDVPVDEVWQALADVGSINRLIAFLGDVTVDGDERVCALGDGELRELIVSVDEEQRRVAYSIQESPFGFRHHHSSMQAVREGEGTRFVWWTDVSPDEAAPALGEALDGALESIRDVFAAGAPVR